MCIGLTYFTRERVEESIILLQAYASREGFPLHIIAVGEDNFPLFESNPIVKTPYGDIKVIAEVSWRDKPSLL